MRNSVYFLAGIIIAIGLAGCKPTEKNYKAAYDAALGKREAATADVSVSMAQGTLQQVDGPQLKKVDGRDVYVLNTRIMPVEKDEKLKENYNVAVGCYKMSTNCIAQAEALRQEGYDAFAAKDSDPLYYTVAGSFPTISEAVKFYQQYQLGKDRVYVGLPSSPVIIYSPK